MKSLRLLIPILLLFVFAVPLAAHDDGHNCPHGGATIPDLQNCIAHAATMGTIDNAGVLRGLQAKLDAAQSAYDRGQVEMAVNNLNAFINLAEAQTGKHIVGQHAAHMIHHAELVIAAISQ